MDVLAIGAHPDDVELCAGGTICKLTSDGYEVGIVDLTAGELGSRGTVATRAREAAEAAAVMEVSVRDNLGMPDGDIGDTRANRDAVIRVIRRHRPHVLLVGATECRHPDHADATRLVLKAQFQAGLRMIQTADDDGSAQQPWRPAYVLHYMQTLPFEPTVVVDVTDVWEQRMKALLSYRTQFFDADYQPEADEPDTFISNPDFLRWVEARARSYGYPTGATYGEPFRVRGGGFGTDDLMATLSKNRLFK